MSADKSAGFHLLDHQHRRLGRPFTKTYDLPKGRVQPFWCMISAPADAAPGEDQNRVRTAAATTSRRACL